VEPMPDVVQPAAAPPKRQKMPDPAGLMASLPSRFGPVWRALQSAPPTERVVNRWLINKGVSVVPPRPYRLSTKAPFTSQETLTDKTYNTRQLPPCEPGSGPARPDVDKVVDLFRRRDFIPCEKSTVLFAYVAQWFTDGLLRSDRSVEGKDERDITRNESTHEVDLAQLYGLKPKITKMLRDPHNPMLLAYQGEPGAELPPALYDDKGVRLKHFEKLRTIGEKKDEVDKTQLLAMGSDAGNTQIGYAMLNTLFLREHNRLARELAEHNPKWDEDQIFAAARNVLTVLLIKVVIEEYINHITPYHFRFRLDPRGFDKQPWMRPNWTAVEFNLLYRWHSLVPSQLDIGSRSMTLEETMFRSRDLLQDDLGALFDSASKQRAGRVGLRNTAPWLVEMTERPTICHGRTVDLQGYNAYRVACKLKPAGRFEDISSDAETCSALRELYGDVDDVEFYVGMMAEDPRPNSVLGPLVGRLVGLHAFSQLMTNPLLAPEIYGPQTFSERGMKIIEQTTCLGDVVRRNVSGKNGPPLVTMTRADWRHT
ncbi:MAG TPA: peroxidase family protein, partial [Solirubrobacteraceae bacterium]